MTSKQPRKQRKTLKELPKHKRHKQMSASLSPELRKKYGKRNFPVVKGDKVKLIMGKLSGTAGKVTNVNLKKYKINIDGIIMKKQDGKEVPRAIAPSNILITELNLVDSKRVGALERGIKT